MLHFGTACVEMEEDTEHSKHREYMSRTSRLADAGGYSPHLLLQHLAHLHLVCCRRAAVESPELRLHQRLCRLLLELHVVVAHVRLRTNGKETKHEA